jgi:hypothetical protein
MESPLSNSALLRRDHRLLLKFWRVEFNTMTLTLVDGPRYRKLREAVAILPKCYLPITISTEHDVIHSPILSPIPGSPLSSGRSLPSPNRTRATSSPTPYNNQSLRATSPTTNHIDAPAAAGELKDHPSPVPNGQAKRRTSQGNAVEGSPYLLPPSAALTRSQSLPSVQSRTNDADRRQDTSDMALSSPVPADELRRLMFSPVAGRKESHRTDKAPAPIMYEELLQKGYVFEFESKNS